MSLKPVKKINIAFTVILITALLPLSMAIGNSGSENGNYLDKFHAHSVVQKLTRKNLSDIEFLEIIAKNFGYVDNYQLRKDYWRANLMVTSGKIINARKGLEKNRADITESLKKTASLYRRDALKILDECAGRLSVMKLNFSDNKDDQNKLAKNQLRLKIAYEELRNADKAFLNKQYRNSINLLRTSKRQALKALKSISSVEERKQLLNKYKIHIVDNRLEVYKKG